MPSVHPHARLRWTGRDQCLQFGIAAFLALVLALGVTLAGGVRAAGDVVDQSYGPNPYSAKSPTGGPMAQTFTAGITGQLDRVQVKVDKYAIPTAPTDPLIVDIYATSSDGTPTGSALATSSIAPANVAYAPTQGPTFAEADFSPTVSVTAGTVYAIVVTTNDPNGNYLWWTGFSPNYPGGVSMYYSGGQWNIPGAGTNYDQQFQTFVIPSTKLDQTITFGSLPNKTFGNAPFTISASASSGLPVSFAAAPSTVCTFSTVNSRPTITIVGAGTCTVTASQGGNDAFNPATDVPQSFTVAQATPSISWKPTFPPLYYGDPLPSFIFNATATGVGGTSLAGSFTYTYSGTTAGGQAVSGTATTSTILPAGSYTMSASFTPTDTTDYTSVAPVSANLTINKKTPMVSWTPSLPVVGSFPPYGPEYGLTYGNALGAAELNAVVLGIDGKPLAGDFSYMYFCYVDCGSPPATTGLVLPPGLYLLHFQFTPADAADYNTTAGSIVLQVNPAPLTISAEDQTMPYHGTVPAFAVDYATFVNGDGPSGLTGSLTCVVKDQGGNTVDPSSASPGKYTIDCSGSTLATPKYTISYKSGTLTITQATPVITWANPAAITYNTALGATQLNASTNVAGSFTYDPPAGTVLGAGDHTLAVTFTPSDTTDYTTAQARVPIHVNAAPLTITPDDQTMTVGGALPTFTWQGNGWVTGEGPSALTTAPTCTTTATSTSPAGPYPITCTGAVDSNYVISYKPGTLKILYAPAGTMCLGAPGHQVLPPINTDGSSVFKAGNTVPVKFRVCDANGNSIGTAGVVSSFVLVKTSSAPGVTVNQTPTSTTPDTAFRWSATDQQWIFNLSTNGLNSSSTYSYEITLNDGSTIDFSFSLK